MVELKPFKGDYYLWKYLPSIPLAGVFAGIFLILTSLLFHRIFRTRYFSAIPFLIGGSCTSHPSPPNHMHQLIK